MFVLNKEKYNTEVLSLVADFWTPLQAIQCLVGSKGEAKKSFTMDNSHSQKNNNKRKPLPGPTIH